VGPLENPPRMICIIGLFFFIKNLPYLWYLNTAPHSNHLKGLRIEEEILFWSKLCISILLSVLVPFTLGLKFLKIKKGY
jgi:hypothetical protein